jgi:signal transduction histidine kinase
MTTRYFVPGLRMLLGSIGHDVNCLEAGTITDALALVTQHPDIELCLLDLSLKDEQGFGAIQHIKTTSPHIASACGRESRSAPASARPDRIQRRPGFQTSASSPARSQRKHRSDRPFTGKSPQRPARSISSIGGVLRSGNPRRGPRETDHRVRAEFQHPAAQKSLSSIQELEPLRVLGDPVAIGRIARNLIDNAIRYTDQSTVEISLHSEVLGDAALAVMAMTDTGKGIPASEHSRIFEEFYQLDNPGRDRSRGVGLLGDRAALVRTDRRDDQCRVHARRRHELPAPPSGALECGRAG